MKLKSLLILAGLVVLGCFDSAMDSSEKDGESSSSTPLSEPINDSLSSAVLFSSSSSMVAFDSLTTVGQCFTLHKKRHFNSFPNGSYSIPSHDDTTRSSYFILSQDSIVDMDNFENRIGFEKESLPWINLNASIVDLNNTEYVWTDTLEIIRSCDTSKLFQLRDIPGYTTYLDLVPIGSISALRVDFRDDSREPTLTDFSDDSLVFDTTGIETEPGQPIASKAAPGLQLTTAFGPSQVGFIQGNRLLQFTWTEFSYMMVYPYNWKIHDVLTNRALLLENHGVVYSRHLGKQLKDYVTSFFGDSPVNASDFIYYTADTLLQRQICGYLIDEVPEGFPCPQPEPE